MPNYNKQKQRLAFKGVNLNAAVDAIPPDQLGIATNVRPTQQGTLGTRPAIAPFITPVGAVNPIHSIKTFSASGVTRRFTGAVANLWMDTALVDTGYSGNPLSFAAYQPSQAVQPFLYVADSARYRKFRASDGAKFNVGIVPPPGPPDANLIQPLYTSVNEFDSAPGWGAGGTAGAPTAVDRVPAGTTVAAILYDVGSTGWACVAFETPSTTWLTKGASIYIENELSKVSDMIAQSSDSTTTIAAIQYDTGASGACCFTLASSTENLSRDTFLQLGSENVRILSVAIGEDNTVSLRCVTVGTHAAGEGVTFYNCARMYLTVNHSVGAAVLGNCLTSTVTVGLGTLTLPLGMVRDLSQINGRPLTTDDWMHISLLFDNLDNLSDVRILLDVDNTTNDFTHNFYYADITANVLQQASSGAAAVVTAGSTALQATGTQAQLQALYAQAEEYAAAGNYVEAAALQNTISQLNAQINAQLVTGASQWSEIFVPLSALTRVGNDQTVGLYNVKAIQIQIVCTDTINISIDSWWCGGTYGPNAPQAINPENPIKYCYRYRSTITGAQSTWSPLTRGGIFAERQGIGITGAAYSTDPQVDTIDFARVGASINGTPQYLASVANNTAGGFATYVDNFQDAELGDQIIPGDNQPWPVQQPPIIGTCSVVGTTVFATSVTIPTNLCQGTNVLINGQETVIRGLPGTNTFQVEDNIDTANGVSLQIWSPTTFGNPLPFEAGPFDESIFAAGDPVNPGRVYFANRTNPDTAATSNFVDLTSSAEPILGICVWNGYVVAMTAEQFFIGTTSGQVGNPYAFTTTGVGCGLLAPWAFTTGPGIFFWTRNGIAVTELGPATPISSADLYPYLPHEGIPGQAVNGYLPPMLNVMPRLGYCKNGWLYFDFEDSGGNQKTLAFDTTKPGWWFDCYTPAVMLHYQDEAENSSLVLCGCADGTLEQFSTASADTGGPITCQARLGSQNYGDLRSLKQVIDLALELVGTVQLTVYANSWTVSDYTSAVTGTAGTPIILPIAAAYDATKLYLDFAVDLTWTGVQQVIEFDLGYLQNPMLAGDFVSNPTTLLFDGYGHVREVILNTVSKAALTANLVINAEFPGTITVLLNIPQGPYRQYVRLPANKGMLYEWSLQGSGLDFGLFACDLHVKGWRESAYRIAAPFSE